MIRSLTRVGAGLALLGVAMTMSAGAAVAHERREIAGHQVVVGWADEPAFAGFKNAVSFRATQGGSGVEGLQMKVEVIFGDKDGTEKVGPLDLGAAFGDPGHYEAAIIPTRSGTYTFHIIGTLGNEPFDQLFTSSEQTFDNIGEPKEVQFPVKDPSTGELAELTGRLGSRVDATSNDATDQATFAQNLSYGGIGLGMVALILALVAITLARKRST